MSNKLFLASIIGLGLSLAAVSTVIAVEAPKTAVGHSEVKPATSTNHSEVKYNTDSLVEFKQKQDLDIQQFIKQKQTEYASKAAQIKQQRLSCNQQVTNSNKQRAEQRKQLAASCKPTPNTSEPTTKEEAISRAAQIKATLQACQQKVKDFDTATKAQITKLKSSCVTQERKVLGLSTDIPYNQ